MYGGSHEYCLIFQPVSANQNHLELDTIFTSLLILIRVIFCGSTRLPVYPLVGLSFPHRRVWYDSVFLCTKGIPYFQSFLFPSLKLCQLYHFLFDRNRTILYAQSANYWVTRWQYMFTTLAWLHSWVILMFDLRNLTFEIITLNYFQYPCSGLWKIQVTRDPSDVT